MTDKVHGKLRRYWLMQASDQSEVLESFDSLEEAAAYAETLSSDRLYVVRDEGRDLVWPKPNYSGNEP